MAESHCSTTHTSSSLSRPKTEPVRLGDLLPDALAEMRRIESEREHYEDTDERTEKCWADENAYILARSRVATPRTLARRRRIIERSAATPYPLHWMDHDEIIAEADADRKPDHWLPVGVGTMPIAWLPRRSYYEWHWLRGNDPSVARPPIPLHIKAAVLERDWPNCQICGGLIALGEQHLDHIKPFSMGGEDTVENLRLAHDLCNMRRGAGR